MGPVVVVEDLRKVYGKTTAVDGISFEVQAGEIFGMLGPNGAGKTTTIECLEGLRNPTSGKVQVLGADPREQGQALCQRVGMQLQSSNLPERMKVWEALDLYASFYPRAADWKGLLLELGLEEKRNTPFSKLSGGQRQRLFIALALLPDPQLIFLDELTTGLDPQARRAIWDLVRDVRARGKTVLLTTHFMEEAERLCDRVAILDHGRIVALDTPAGLIHSMGGEERVLFSIRAALPASFEEDLPGEARVQVNGDQVIIQARSNRQSPLVGEVVAALGRHAIQYYNLRTDQPNLEDVFLSLTGRELRQ